MATKILTLCYAPSLGVFDEAPLLALSHSHEVLALREHFFVFQDIPHLLCVITCHPRGAVSSGIGPSIARPRR